MNNAYRFENLARRFADNLAMQGVQKPAFANQQYFKSLPENMREFVIGRMQLQVEQMELLNPEIEEFEKLRVICSYHNLKPVDESIFTKLARDSAWEIIDFKLTQLYRNKVVFQMGDYSIEEYETIPPWELFKRPAFVIQTLTELTKALATSKSILNLQEVKPYIIEETLTERQAQFEIAHQFACPLQDKLTGENVAFVSVFKLKAISSELKLSMFN